MLTWFISTKKIARPRRASTPSNLVNLRVGLAADNKGKSLLDIYLIVTKHFLIER